MSTPKSRWLFLCASALAVANAAPAPENGALLDALIRKGILTHQEAADIRAELVQENNAPPPRVTAGGRSTERLSVGMRMQIQHAHFDTDVRGATAGPARTDHAFLRRMYLTLKASVGGKWGATMTYDFASSGYDDAIIEWRPAGDLSFDFGLRKVNVAYEERASSGNLKSIERSGITRYFVESNNGRRLGAASYRIGAFLDGQKRFSDTFALVYGAALTNPERNETFNLASSFGDGATNKPALWANVAVAGKLPAGGRWIAGIGAGHLSDQGGAGPARIGRGHDLSVYSIFTDITRGRFGFMGEFLAADIERGASDTRDAMPAGFFLQPSLLLTDTLEFVMRYQRLDTDGRGVQLSDVMRSAPAGPTMDKFEGWYAGTNWYLRSNDLKLQLGLAYGKTHDTPAGEPAEAKSIGVRSQMQVQF